MQTMFSLTKRNIKMFFKDKPMFMSSLLVPLILLVLYTTFLANVYLDSFKSSIPEGFTADGKIINGLVASQLFSSLLAVSCVTVAFCSNIIMVQDKYFWILCNKIGPLSIIFLTGEMEHVAFHRR